MSSPYNPRMFSPLLSQNAENRVVNGFCRGIADLPVADSMQAVEGPVENMESALSCQFFNGYSAWEIIIVS